MSDSVVITGMARTPMGGMQGSLSDVASPTLGGDSIKASLERSGVSPERIDETIMGCVLPAGLGQAPARQASLNAGIPDSTGCVTINKMCGSGMKAVMMGHDATPAGSANLIVAGGMESMTNAPYILPKVRGGMRLGHGEVLDHMFIDGLEDAYEKGRLMGSYAEDTSKHYGFTREAQDEFAIESLKRAQRAIEKGEFKREISAVSFETRKGPVEVDTDEQPGNAKLDKMPQLRPAFAKDGTVTAANSSSISDGAAAMVLSGEKFAKENNLTINARIIGHSNHAHEPRWFTTAPVSAVQKLMDKLNWSVGDVDLFEVNEAFGSVPMSWVKALGADITKLNIRGGACALGHPVGASGARIIVTLVHALQDHGLKRGVASLCIGGGEATAVGIELV